MQVENTVVAMVMSLLLFSKFEFCKMVEFVKLDDMKTEILKTFEQLISNNKNVKFSHNYL